MTTTITIVITPRQERHREWIAENVSKFIQVAHGKGIDVELTIDESEANERR